MINDLFLKNKISRQINDNGNTYVVRRYEVDEYNQRKDDPINTSKIKGLFHEVVSNVKSISETDGARITIATRPFLLCLYEDGCNLFLDDEIIINKETYKVIDKINIGNFNVAYDIILERIKYEI